MVANFTDFENVGAAYARWTVFNSFIYKILTHWLQAKRFPRLASGYG
jgi:hypothetical protein